MYTKAKMFQSKVEWEGGHFQGDIDIKDGEIPKISYFNAVCSKDQLWPDKTVYYYIDEKRYDSDQITKIEEAAEEIQRKTGCMYLFRVSKSTKENYLAIEPLAGCSSSVGMVGGCQTLSLTRNCLFNRGTIIHAFMHALGFHHEHCRGNRNDHVTVHWDNIAEKDWKAFSRADESHGASYDFDSVMHFGQRALCKDPMMDSLTPVKSHHKIGQRERLSQMDVERIRILYGDLDPADSEHFDCVKAEDVFKPANWLHKIVDRKS